MLRRPEDRKFEKELDVRQANPYAIMCATLHISTNSATFSAYDSYRMRVHFLFTQVVSIFYYIKTEEIPVLAVWKAVTRVFPTDSNRLLITDSVLWDRE